jgi:hypothetical protein
LRSVDHKLKINVVGVAPQKCIYQSINLCSVLDMLFSACTKEKEESSREEVERTRTQIADKKLKELHGK